MLNSGQRNSQQVQKVTTEDNNPNNKLELSYDEWIDANLKNICDHKSGRINYVNRKNKSPNRVETKEIIKELSRLDLADASVTKAKLRPFGERVCKSNGWIEYLKIKRQVDTLKYFNGTNKEHLETELAKSNIEANKLNARIAKQNEKDRFSNKVAMWVNVIVGIINLSIILWQLWRE